MNLRLTFLLLFCLAMAPLAEGALPKLPKLPSRESCAQAMRSLKYEVYRAPHTVKQTAKRWWKKLTAGKPKKENKEAEGNKPPPSHSPPPKSGSGKGEGGKPAPNEPPRYPPPMNDYQAHNKDTMTPSSGESKMVLRVPMTGRPYFAEGVLSVLEPLTAKWHRANLPFETPFDKISSKSIPMEVDPLGAEYGAIKVPAGHKVVVSGGETVTLRQDELGNVQFKSPDGKPFMVWVERRGKSTVSEDLKKRLTRTPHIPLNRFPEWLEKGVSALKAQPHLRPEAIAQGLKKLIEENMKYRLDKNDDTGILEMAHSGLTQCDGAASLVVHFMRDQFGIPAVFIGGKMGSPDPEDRSFTIVKEPTQGHAWVEYYDKYKQSWELVDATPSKPDREKTDEEKKREKEQSESTDSESSHDQKQNDKDDQGKDNKDDEPDKDGEKDDKSEDKGEEEGSKPTEGSERSRDRLPIPRRHRGAGEMSEVAAAALHAAWMHVVDGYHSSSEIYERTVHFQTHLNELKKKFPQSALPYLYEQQLAKFREAAAPGGGSSFRSLEEMVVQMRTKLDAGASPEKEFAQLQNLLSQVEAARPLNAEEKSLRTALQEISAQRSAVDERSHGVTVGDLDMPPGAVRDWLKDRYQDGKGGLNLARLNAEKNLHAVKRWSQMLAATPLVNFAKVASFASAKKKILKGLGGEPYSGAPVLRTAVDLDQPEFIVRDGTPPEMDGMLMAREELMQMDFPREVYTTGRSSTREPEDETTVIIEDMSGSMGMGVLPYLVRNAIAGAYLNQKNKTGKHEVYRLPYGDNAGPVTRIGGSPAEALNQYLEHPPGYWNQGNDATLAFQAAFNHVSQTKQKKVNLLWLTDGEEALEVNEILSARARVPKEVEIRILAVNIGERNAAMDKIAQESLRKGGTAVGKVVYLNVTDLAAAKIIEAPGVSTILGDKLKAGVAKEELDTYRSGLNDLDQSVSRIQSRELAERGRESAWLGAEGTTEGGTELGEALDAFRDVPQVQRSQVMAKFLRTLAQSKNKRPSQVMAEFNVTEVAKIKNFLAGK